MGWNTYISHSLTHPSIDLSITYPMCQLRGIFFYKKITPKLLVFTPPHPRSSESDLTRRCAGAVTWREWLIQRYWFSDPTSARTLISSDTVRPENKSTGLSPTFCRDGPSKHRRLRHRKEINHQMQRPGTSLAIFPCRGSSNVSNKKGDCANFGNNQYK